MINYIVIAGDAISGVDQLSEPQRQELAAAALASLTWPRACMAIGQAAGRSQLSDIGAMALGALSERERATVLAALRMWQRDIEGSDDDALLENIASDAGLLEPLSPAEIDGLCERLNP